MPVKIKMIRILFWLSFAPYVFLLCYSTYHAIFGYPVYSFIMHHYVETIYGWDAFLMVFIWTGIALCFIPVLPICLLYQIIYLFIYIIKSVMSKVY